MARRTSWEWPLDIAKLTVTLALLALLFVPTLQPASPQMVVTTPPLLTQPADGVTFETGDLLALEGSADPGTTLRLFDGSQLLGETTAGPDGQWRLPLSEALAEGPHSLRAVVVDKAGKEIAASEPVAFTIIPPAAPPEVPPAVAPASGMGFAVAPAITSPVNGARLSVHEPLTIEGTAESGSKVYIYDGDQLLGEAGADAEGRWRFDMPMPLVKGEHHLRAAVWDATGNEVAASVPLTLRFIEAIVPPTILPPRMGVVMPGGMVVGSADPAARLLIYDDGRVLGEAAAGLDGHWRFQLPADLPTGRHALHVAAVDDMGHVLAESEPIRVQVLEFNLPVTGSVPY